MRFPRLAGFLLSLRSILWSGLGLTTDSLREPGPPRPLPRSAAAILLANLETKSAEFLCEALEVFRCPICNGRAFLPNQGSSTRSLFNWVLFGRPKRSLQTGTLTGGPNCRVLLF
jgi:hypothetical protein